MNKMKHIVLEFNECFYSGTEFLIVCPRANLGSDADFLTGGLVEREERPR